MQPINSNCTSTSNSSRLHSLNNSRVVRFRMPNRSNCTANNNNNKITFTLPQIPNNNLFNLDSRDYLDNSRYHVYHSPVQSAIHNNNNNNQRMTTALDTHNRRPLGITVIRIIMQ